MYPAVQLDCTAQGSRLQHKDGITEELKTLAKVKVGDHLLFFLSFTDLLIPLQKAIPLVKQLVNPCYSKSSSPSFAQKLVPRAPTP